MSPQLEKELYLIYDAVKDKVKILDIGPGLYIVPGAYVYNIKYYTSNQSFTSYISLSKQVGINDIKEYWALLGFYIGNDVRKESQLVKRLSKVFKSVKEIRND